MLQEARNLQPGSTIEQLVKLETSKSDDCYPNTQYTTRERIKNAVEEVAEQEARIQAKQPGTQRLEGLQAAILRAQMEDCVF